MSVSNEGHRQVSAIFQCVNPPIDIDDADSDIASNLARATRSLRHRQDFQRSRVRQEQVVVHAASQVVHIATIDHANVAGSMFTIRETSYGDVTPASMDQDEPT